MRGSRDDAASRHQPARDRRRLSDEEEAWIARQLVNAPPLDEAVRHKIERLLALPPDNAEARCIEPRAS